MTIEEKRRELFEAEHQAEHDQLVAEYGDLVPDMGYERFDSGLYKNGLVQAAWWGFNAALDAVEIQLPIAEHYTDDKAYSAVADCHAAIEETDLGLKVK